MSRTIAGSYTGSIVRGENGKFPPMVGIGKIIGQFIRGRVLEIGTTKKGNTVISLALIDLNGSSAIQVSKDVYAEVEVNAGDTVQLVATLTDLKEKLPQLAVNDVVTVTYKSDVPSGRGKPKKIFEVLVD